MPNDNDDDLIGMLIGLGVLAVVGIGVLTVLKAIAEYEPGETISKEQALELASGHTPMYTPPETSTISIEDDDGDDYYPDYWAEDEEDADDD